ncbi:MAG: hypothetical protein RIT81_37395 [Deltaproteobacteria bacterium]
MSRAAAWALAVFGTVHMVGHLVDSTPIKGLAAATAASPAPKVFSSVQGLETYSTSFVLEWSDPVGKRRSLPITRAIYARVEGPYNRRNVYGAVLAFGPVLVTNDAARPMYESVLRYAACGERPLLAELGLDVDAVRDPVVIHVVPPEGVELDLPLSLEAPCR